MPPIGKDDQTHAMLALNVLECAKQLVAEITRGGGVGKLESPQPYPALQNLLLRLGSLVTETSKLQMYESRAAAHGTLVVLTDEKLAEAIHDVRRRQVLTVGQEEALSATPEQIAVDFSLDAEPGAIAPVHTDSEPVPPSGERAPEDPFSL